MEKIIEQVKEIVANAVDLEVGEFGNDEHLYNDLGADSVIGFEIITKLQKKFGVAIDTKEAPTIMTVNKMAELVSSKMVTA
jgi:acyl carrier protein